jgi:hypothetical protein
MKRRIMALLLLAAGCRFAAAQELFVYTEPASNMPKGSLGFRATNMGMQRQYDGRYQYFLLPEATIGISKKWMLRIEGVASNNRDRFTLDGASLYTKYRFWSQDRVQRHLRMAAFGRASYITSPIHHQQEIETTMLNSGYEGGLVVTQLLHKLALSVAASYERALDNGSRYKFPNQQNAHVLNYSLSAGRLLLPKQYKNYQQTNLNLMVELLGQYNVGFQRSYLDAAPSVQFIFNSRWRVDAGYRQQLFGGLQRMANNSFLLRAEYNFFNVF